MHLAADGGCVMNSENSALCFMPTPASPSLDQDVSSVETQSASSLMTNWPLPTKTIFETRCQMPNGAFNGRRLIRTSRAFIVPLVIVNGIAIVVQVIRLKQHYKCPLQITSKH
jgi:hypothetical protein